MPDHSAQPHTTSPYGDTAPQYLTAGWRGPLPLPAGQKQPVPKGYTGRAGGWPNGPTVYDWTETNPHGNIALRLPENVIGIDIDAYPGKPGAFTFLNTEEKLGKLPATWRTTSRDDGVSGIRLFTIPEGLEWPNEIGPGIEIVRYAHRYAVVWPSIHPDTGNTYKWIGPDGTPHIGTIPHIDDLPPLPATWVQHFTHGREDTREARTPLDPGTAAGVLELFNTGTPCREVTRALTKRVTELHAPGHGARHDIMLIGTERLIRLGIEGHKGITTALAELRDAFTTSIGADRSPLEIAQEWDRSLQGALANVHTVENVDPCEDPFHGLIDRTPPVTPEPAHQHEEEPAHLTREETAHLEPGEEPKQGSDTPTATTIAREQLIAQEYERERARREAKRLLEEENATTPTELTFHTITDIRNRPKPEWIVTGLIQGSGVVLLAGEAGLGKSFACLDIAARVATGQEFFGRKVRAGNVAYVYAEGGEYLPERWDAWETHNNTHIPENRLLIVEEGFNLSDPASVTTMTTQVTQRGIDLLILDTLSQLSSVENENDAAQLAKVLTAARHIRMARPGMTVLIVHHVNKGEKARIRGSSVIKSNADAVIVALTDKNGENRFTLSTLPQHDGKQKNAKAEALPGFYLETVGESAALARETPEGAEAVAIDAVLADGDWHAPSEFYDFLGDNSLALQKKVLRRLNILEDRALIERIGKTKGTRYRATPPADSDTQFGHEEAVN